ncbi:MAG: biotin/lipoyl-containing protein, partial [Thermoanaerobaculia bacterium]
MATDVIMPQMGESIAEGTITKWLAKVGDRVERDQPLFEISTDKVDAEIPSPADGVLLEISHGEGETVEVNQIVARIGEAGEQLAAAAPTAPEATPEPETEAAAEEESEAPTEPEREPVPAPSEEPWAAPPPPAAPGAGRVPP